MIVNPTLKRFISRAYKNGHGELHLKSTEEVRAHLESLKPPGVIACDFEDHNPRPHVSFRIYRQPESTMTVLYIRASAYTGGGKLDDTNGICDTLRNLLKANIVSLNFRTPPEHKFPTYFDDVCKSTLWIKAHLDKLHLAGPIISWGESSGGALVASLNQFLSKTSNQLFDAQVLIYPMLDLVTQTPSRQKFASGYMLDVAMINWLEQRVLNSALERDDYRASPGLHHVPGQPPLIMLTCECDPLRDEGYAYAKLLEGLGTQVKYHCVPNMIHGFLRYYNKMDAAGPTLDWIKSELKAVV